MSLAQNLENLAQSTPEGTERVMEAQEIAAQGSQTMPEAQREVIVLPSREAVAQSAADRTITALIDLLNRHEYAGDSANNSKSGGDTSETSGTDSHHNHSDGEQQRVAHLGLTGGSDTLQALSFMAQHPLLGAVDWQRVHVWWVDERFVAADSPLRNALQAKQRLLDQLVASGMLPARNIHEMPADERSVSEIDAMAGEASATAERNRAAVDAAAAAYADELQRYGMHALDIALLGMGPDGHFASLFPQHREILITDASVVGVTNSPKLPPLRLSMTAPLLRRTARAYMLTGGADKASATAAVLRQPCNPAYPASYAAATREWKWITTPETLRGIA